MQQCQAGLIEVRRGEGILSFAAPPTRRSGELTEEELAPIIEAFGIARDRVVAHQWVDNGPGWSVLQIDRSGEPAAHRPRRRQAHRR